MELHSRIGIRVSNVTKRLGKTQALDDISMEFPPALLHGIIGPNGAGKTTLLRMMMNLLKPGRGEIVYYSGETKLRFPEIRAKFAYFPQEQSLYPDLSVREHLEFFRDLYQIPGSVYSKKMEELLYMTRLQNFRERKAGELSGGMYKKLGLACVLLHSPEILLLDEPTNGVDPTSRRELWELLYRLTAEKILVILSTSYMDEAERCSRVHLIEEGRLILSGEPREILKREKALNFEEIFLNRTGSKSA